MLISGAKSVISSIDGRLQSLDPSNKDEFETALESLGQIGLSKYVVLWLRGLWQDPLHLFIGKLIFFIYHFALVKHERKIQGENLSNSEFLVNSLKQIWYGGISMTTENNR